jgi:hypothetical protein
VTRNLIVQIGKKVIYETVLDGFDSGDIYVTADNIRGATA